MDMKNQFEMMNKMGPMQQVLNMIPGMGNKISKEASKMTEDKIDSYKIMMSSMTEEEMLNPKIIKQSRIQRIARGSGVDETEVKELLKYYNNTKKTMKGIFEILQQHQKDHEGNRKTQRSFRWRCNEPYDGTIHEQITCWN